MPVVKLLCLVQSNLILTKLKLLICESLVLQQPAIRVGWSIMLCSWIFKMGLVDFLIWPFLFVEEFLLISILFFSFIPLVDFDISLDFDSVVFEVIDILISHLNLSLDHPSSMNQLKVMIVHDTVGLTFYASSACLLDQLVDSHLLPLVKPNHGDS